MNGIVSNEYAVQVIQNIQCWVAIENVISLWHNLFNLDPNTCVSHQKCIEDDPCTKILQLKNQSPINSIIFYMSYATLFWSQMPNQ